VPAAQRCAVRSDAIFSDSWRNRLATVARAIDTLGFALASFVAAASLFLPQQQSPLSVATSEVMPSRTILLLVSLFLHGWSYWRADCLSNCVNRRNALGRISWGSGTTTAFTNIILLAPPSSAQADATTLLLKGTVTLSSPEVVAAELSSQESPALYITCRPDRADNVPAAILTGTRGKPPPVLAARFANPSFPFQFSLSTDNVTPEGAASEENGAFWWKDEDLIVSARWDYDGVAATRSPEDLVGRGLLRRKVDETVAVQLEGRGAFGKFATKKS